MNRIIAFALGLAVHYGAPAVAETYYVAPPGTASSVSPTGAETRPFVGLEAAFDSGKVKGGDTLLLKGGAYGSIDIKAAFSTPVIIQSQTDKTAQFDWIQLSAEARNITLKNLSVWPSNPAAGRNFLVRSFETTSDITADGLDIRSEQQAAAYMSWNAAKWNARKYSGIALDGPRSTVVRNRLTGVNFGIMIGSGLIEGNLIDGYSGDALRSWSDSVVKRNRVLNCVEIDDNHADGFQSWAGSEPVRNLTIDSNTFIEWTGDQSHPLRCGLQGIGLFDGPYDNLTITNNLVSVSAYHGIAVYGARGARIINNTVVHVFGKTAQEPWLGVFDFKSGAPSTDVLVANNVAMRYMGTTNAATRVEFRKNSVVGTPGSVFENTSAFDYRPRAGSALINSADATVAPPRDILNQIRPSGGAPDRGSYEIQVETTPPPTDVVTPPPTEVVTPPPTENVVTAPVPKPPTNVVTPPPTKNVDTAPAPKPPTKTRPVKKPRKAGKITK
jgi:parallel beta-helix repeat protein